MSVAAPVQTQIGKPPASSHSKNTGLLVQRQCACGSSSSSMSGACPECQNKRLQTKLRIGASTDPLEQEADRVADQVMSAGNNSTINNAPLCIQRLTSHLSNTSAPASVDRVLASGGRPLQPALQQDMSQRFGHDFSRVRVHSGTAAEQSARDINAHAYTVGHNVVFGAGQYAPESHAGRRLLAHELTHVVQQTSGRDDWVQRTLTVNTTDSVDPTTAVATIQPLVHALCPDFGVAPSGDITAVEDSDCADSNFAALATGTQPVGCCCLCTLTTARAAWTIVVTPDEAPTTDQPDRVVKITPTSGPTAPEFRAWSGATPTETVQPLSFAAAFGHELCGHAALMQIRAHPQQDYDRAFSDEHDPTVRVENELANEMASRSSQPRSPRGLAGSGVHRGESLRVFTVGPYGTNADDPTPFARQVTDAVNFLNGNDRLLVDTVGLRDTTDTNTTISRTRAENVEAELTTRVTPPTVSVRTRRRGPTETLDRVQPATDEGLDATRTVELRIAAYPAGLIAPIGAAPPASPAHEIPAYRRNVRALQAGGRGVNPCSTLLANTAWPRPPRRRSRTTP